MDADRIPPPSALRAQGAALRAYLRLLWNRSPALWPLEAEEPGMPFLSPAGLHLPSQPPAAAGLDGTQWLRAAAAHACAHLVYSEPAAHGPGLKPLTRALVGMLEDARVEWLACRELPGLRRLWLPLHTASSHSGDDAVTLMARLARALLDPGYADPHPWVLKGRRLFFVDEQGLALALRQPAVLRYAASLLGNDLGQMRLQFNPRLYRPQPTYRDDNRWLWQADAASDAVARTQAGPGTERDAPVADPLSGPGAAPPPPPPHAPEAGEPEGVVRAQLYPEWDRLIARHRPRWCAVVEEPAVAGPEDAAPPRMPMRSATSGGWLRRQREGEELDLQALLDRWVSRRTGRPTHDEDRLHQARRRRRGTASVLLLLDTSASTAEAAWPGGPSLLALGRQVALRTALALQAAGDRCAVHGFCSDGRQRVLHRRVADFGEPLEAGRLAALRSGLSTRLGTALRHGAARLAAQPGRRRMLLLLSDGQAHDIDVHDLRYLREDAVQAVRAARRQGVQVLGLDLGGHGGASLRRLLGGRVQALRRLDELRRALQCLGL